MDSLFDAEKTEGNGRNRIFVLLLIMVLLAIVLFSFSRLKSVTSLTGFTALENAEVIPEKEVYTVGDLATLFIFPKEADYEIEVYDPSGQLYANALNFPVENAGIYRVKAIISSSGQEREVSAQFNVLDEEGNDVSLLNAVPAADESTPINKSADEAEQTSNAAGIVSSLLPSDTEQVQKVEEVGDVVKDEENNAVGKKVEDDSSFETFFTFVGKEGNMFRLSFYHNSTRQQPIWVEGDVNAQISDAVAQPNETIEVIVPLIDGRIPRFKLHIGPDSDVFEFGITVINLKSYPSIGGNWTVRFTTEGMADLTITPINGTSFGNDLEFIELRCGNTKLDAQYGDGKVYYPSYSCAEEGSEASHVSTGGTHNLMFEFGDAKAFAENFASKYVCSDNCDYSELIGCLLDMNNTDTGCVLNESNHVYQIDNVELSFYFPITDVADAAIKINSTNITLNCNNSAIIGGSTGYGISINKQSNATIKNCNITTFDYGIYIDAANITLVNNTRVMDSATTGIYLTASSNTNLTYSKVTGSVAGHGIDIKSSDRTYVKEMNCSHNYLSNLYSEKTSTYTWIYDSYFYNSTGSYNVDIRSNDTTIENSKILNTTTDNQGGLVVICSAIAGTICNNVIVRNNTAENNGLNFALAHSNNALIENNYFGEHTDADFSGLGVNYNTVVIDCLYCNATIRNNIFNSSKGHQLAIGRITAPYTLSSFVNISNNTFYRTPAGYYDIAIEEEGSTNNSIYNNSFYSGKGVNDTFGYNNTYCVQSTGNFYLLGTNTSYIPAGDCGPANITNPNISSTYPGETNISINWTRQSSMQGNMTYYVYYSFNSGSSWSFAGNTTGLNYTLDISSFPNTPKFGVKVVPFDSRYNGTQTNVTGMRLGPDNQWICSLDNICEYNNITGALDSENNTANNITLLDSNMVYGMYKIRGYNLSVDVANEAAIMINGTNVTLNCNTTEIVGGLTGYGIYFAGFDNVTIQNCRLRNYSIGINISNSIYSNLSNLQVKQNSLYGIYAFNITNSSFTNMNSSENAYDNAQFMNSSNNTITGGRFINSTEGRGIVLNQSSYNIITSINSSINKLALLVLANHSDSNTIQTSSFENSTSDEGMIVYSSNNTLFKNTIKDIKTSLKSGIVLNGKSASGIGNYNNISNNTIKNADLPILVLSYGNWIQNNIINGSSTTTYGAITLAGYLVENNTVNYNVINNSQGNGIYVGFYADGYAARANITMNIVERSGISGNYYDLYINTSSNNTNVWNNSFYRRGVIDYGTNNMFCVGNAGNFYWENITSAYRGSNDCGPINITAPDGGGSYKGIIKINWTAQTSPRNVSYRIFYSTDSGTTWTYLNSTSLTNYSWDTSWLSNYSMSGMLVKVMPYDNYYNATADNSTSTFNLTINNNWVCSNSSYCEYLDITSALEGQNNIVEVITLMDANKVYAVTGTSSYNLSPPATGAAINISKSNVTLDCNNALIFGSGNGRGIFSSGYDNLTIMDCHIYNYSFGIMLISGRSDNLSSITINSSKKGGLNLSGINKSTVEYGKIFASITSNIILENSYNNTIRYTNVTNASQYGIYLKSSDRNNIQYVNSSANNLDNAYIDVNSDNNTIENSTFSNSTRSNVYIMGNRNNINSSIFSNSSQAYFDLLINGSASYTSVWLNNFYSRGINDSGLSSIFCVNNSGNYYDPNISSTYKPTGSCGALAVPYADIDRDGYYTIYDCNDNTSMIYPGALEYCDKFDNDCDGSIDEGACVAEKFKSAGTGGSGGGGGYAFTTYRDINIEQEPEFSMAKSDEVRFVLKGVEHRLKVNKIYEYSVSATISSEDITFEINLNETKQFDIDKDNILDLSVKLTSISGPKASFYLQYLESKTEEKPQQPEGQPQQQEQQKPEEVRQLPEEEKPSKVSMGASWLKKIWETLVKTKKTITLVISLLVVIALLASGIIYYRDVVGRIKPMEDFIESAAAKGYSKQRIKEELMETGWDEEVVDSVLSMHIEMDKVETDKEGTEEETAKEGMKEDITGVKEDINLTEEQGAGKDRITELKEYIDKALQNGFTKEQLKEFLTKKGWDKGDVEDLLK